MADTYDILSSATVTEFVPPNRTRERVEVTATAKPSGVTFPVRVVPEDMRQPNLGLILGEIAAAFNALAALPGVADVAVNQDVDANNQVVTYATVTVESDSGDLQQDVRLPWGDVFGVGGYPDVTRVRKNLNALAGS